MKRIIFISAFSWLLSAASVMAQMHTQPGSQEAVVDLATGPIALFLDSVNQTNKSRTNSLRDFQAFLQKLQLKRDKIKNDKRFFNYLFYKTHRKYLKSYQMHSSVEDILAQGDYDCVSGTAFYALIMKHLGIDYEIKEFDFHVLVIAKSNGQKFLIESTDPAGGLTSDTKEIAERVRQYSDVDDKTENVLSVGAGSKSRQYSTATNKVINLTQLAGLLHFNNAVYYYNQKKPFKTAASLQKSLILYDSKRIRAFRQLAARSFLGDPSLTQIQKEALLDQLGLELVALK